MTPKNLRPDRDSDKWQRFATQPDVTSLNHPPKRPHVLHFVIPILYFGTGTCYALGDLVSPLAIALAHYMIAFAHIAIEFIE
jgi:hypothetical protein